MWQDQTLPSLYSCKWYNGRKNGCIIPCFFLGRYTFNQIKTMKANKRKCTSLMSLKSEVCCHKMSLRSNLWRLCLSSAPQEAPAQKATLQLGTGTATRESFYLHLLLPVFHKLLLVSTAEVSIWGMRSTLVSPNKVTRSWCYSNDNIQGKKLLFICNRFGLWWNSIDLKVFLKKCQAAFQRALILLFLLV